MVMCSPVVINGVDSAEWARIVAAAASRAGFGVTGDRGTYDGHGFRVSWDYEPASETLTVTVMDMPPLLSCDYVNQMIEHGVRAL
jgi:hypothetical protein